MKRQKTDSKRSMLRALLLSSAWLVSACAGNTLDVIQDPGSGGTGTAEPLFSAGVISQASVLTIADLSYNTDAAVVFDDLGRRVAKETLRPGMVVEVNGQAVSADPGNGQDNDAGEPRPFPIPDDYFNPDRMFDNRAMGGSNQQANSNNNTIDTNATSLVGRADVIRLKSLARGFVGPVNETGFELNGIPITSGERVLEGQLVEVYGLFDPVTDRIEATYVTNSASDILKTTGLVSELDRAGGVLRVNGINFDIGQAVLPTSPFGIGSVVQVFYRADERGNPVTVAEVRLANPPMPLTGLISLEAYIDQFDSVEDFVLAGLSVNAATALIEGLEQWGIDLRAGIRVQLFGYIDAGVIRATKVTVDYRDYAV